MWGATESQSRPAEGGVSTGEVETVAVRGPPYVRCSHGGVWTRLHTNRWPPAQPSPRTLSPLAGETGSQYQVLLGLPEVIIDMRWSPLHKCC